jgi:hypothetical protein
MIERVTMRGTALMFAAATTLVAGCAPVPAKYLVVWKKVNGSWKVQYDAFNANAPMAMTK